MLSAREIQVDRLISRGRYEKEIAVQLHIAVATVHAHSRNIREKWHASNQNQLTMTELQKIDILQWMYSELTLEQLKTLKQIAKDIARNEDKTSARPAADLPAAGKRD